MYINRDLTEEEVYKLIKDVYSFVMSKEKTVKKKEPPKGTSDIFLRRLEEDILAKLKPSSKIALSIVTCGHEIYMVPEDGVFNVFYIDESGDSLRSINFNTVEELAAFMRGKAQEGKSITEAKMIVDRLEQKNDD